MRRCQFDSQAKKFRRNLRHLYTRATPADIASGESWYPTAQGYVETWADHYHHSQETCAAVIAALSPQCDWARNLAIAEDVLSRQSPRGGAFRVNVEKACRLRDESTSDTLDVRMARAFPGGPKVQNFAQNLIGNMQAVTIDTHAAQAALNSPTTTPQLPARPYGIFATCYRDTARHVNRTPAEFQAILWCTWKRLYPAAHKRALLRRLD